MKYLIEYNNIILGTDAVFRYIILYLATLCYRRVVEELKAGEKGIEQTSCTIF
tara:strand:+ start:297 stop:455 length:159 start_codon:yes stop_codon:yes gene_type:complete